MANNNSRSESYEKAGVDITAGYRAVELMKKHISRTITPGAMPSTAISAACLHGSCRHERTHSCQRYGRRGNET